MTAVAHALACPADLDSNNIVEVADLLLVLEAWRSDDWLADINDDGLVDFADLLILLAAWGPCE